MRAGIIVRLKRRQGATEAQAAWQRQGRWQWHWCQRHFQPASKRQFSVLWQAQALAKERRKAQRDREQQGEAANLTEAQVDPSGLLLAMIDDIDHPEQNAAMAAESQTVALCAKTATMAAKNSTKARISAGSSPTN